ncbi:MAG: hypothetical protein BWX58_01027 [Deltaproteobacteria bacterium ADurb.Bin026]|nr:MAG: hypothetical protein BWX58_01027 [Deltaproteobacteria bacterium ADurb.Bin026]
MRMERWSSPLPDTLYPIVSVSSSRTRATSERVSRISLSRMCLDVRNLPSFPANGESLGIKFIDIVGGSISIPGSGIGLSGSVNVSPTVMASIPATATISPTPAVSNSSLPLPLKRYIFVMRAGIVEPSAFETITSLLMLNNPDVIFPIASLPRKGE